MVFRELNGLDSILQAGGRCNREGKRKDGMVFIFNAEGTCTKPKINSAKRLLEKFNDITAAECIEEYYNEIFSLRQNQIENNTISRDTKSPYEIKFRSFAEDFKLIKDETEGVIVPQNAECKELLKLLEDDRSVLRKLQKFTVPLKCRGENSEFKRALKQGVIRQTNVGVYVVARLENYDAETGLDIDKAADVFI